MKKRNWLLLLLIVLCLAAFFGYRKLDQLRTDTRAPQIHIDEQPLEVSVRDDKSALLAGVTASDNVLLNTRQCGRGRDGLPRGGARQPDGQRRLHFGELRGLRQRRERGKGQTGGQVYRLRTPPVHAERPAGLYR